MAGPAAGAAGAINPYILGGSILAGPLLKALFPQGFGGQQEFKGVDPGQYYKDIVIDDNDISGIRQGLLNSIKQGIVNPAIKDIKQVGAAKRLPSGAITTGIKGAVSKGAKALTAAEPKLQELKRNSILDFIKMKDSYLGNKAYLNNMNTLNSANFNQSTAGALSKLILLWQGGAFERNNIEDLIT